MDDRPASHFQVGMPIFRRIGFFLGPALFLFVLLMPAPDGMTPEMQRVAALALWMAVWWITEALPLPVTALLPLAVLPTLGVGTIKHASAPYASPAVFLFLGGFIIAIAMERWNLHRRIALNIIRVVGSSPGRMLAGFMIATGFLSMWISNTATVMMMLPIAMSVISVVLDTETDPIRRFSDRRKAFAAAMMLGIAYAANIGGFATLIGTPPNMVFKGFMYEAYGYEIDFLDWMKVGLPLAVFMMVIAWVVLWLMLRIGRLDKLLDGDMSGVIRTEIDKLGRMSRGEIQISIVFCTVAFLWIFQNWLMAHIPYLYLDDASIAILGGLLTFLLPVNWSEGRFLLHWKEAERLPWGIILMFGGGLSLAAALHGTGLADWMGQQLDFLQGTPLVVQVLVVTAVVIMITEIMSNLAVVTAFLPVITVMAAGLGENPLALAIPVTIAASCAFMMPVSTPPNAIVFASGYVRMSQMTSVGLVLNAIFVFVITFATLWLGEIVFDIQEGQFPVWAQPTY